MGGTRSAYRGNERCIQDFGGETRGKEPLARPRRKWEHNIKMDLQEVEWAGVGIDWIGIGTGGWNL
jgi:hypothetical protein